MTSIAHISTQPDVDVAGIFRLVSIKRHPDLADVAQLTLADATGTAGSEVSLGDRCVLKLLDHRTELVRIRGRKKSPAEHGLQLDLDRIEKVEHTERPSWHLLSRSWVPPDAFPAFERLIKLMDRLSNPHIRELGHRLFLSRELAEPFMCVPASRSHHHPRVGGLLFHSVECAEMVEALAPRVLQKEERDLAVIGALLHDVAKTRIMRGRQNAGQDRQSILPRALNLELLAPHLKRFDYGWPEGGEGLRRILAPSISSRRYRSPLCPSVELVRCIDRLSAHADVRFQRLRGPDVSLERIGDNERLLI